MFDMYPCQYATVYNTLSFSLACMMATTVFLWMRSYSVNEKYKSAVVISGLVTFIAAYHYIRIFNSWVDAYEWGNPELVGKDGPNPHWISSSPKQTGVPFNDAYRYMDWLLTVPLLLIEILLVMKLEKADFQSKATKLGLGSALMILSGYYGELTLGGNLAPRWACWFLSMCFFVYIVYELLVGLSSATAAEANAEISAKIKTAQVWTVVSWCTYPVVYLFPMFGIEGSWAVVAIQVGYSISDIISKCGVGLVIYQISAAKTKIENEQGLMKNAGVV
jgi:bacteriorhodopsin